MGIEQYAIYLLVFTFGYVTSRTFYFFSSIRHSIRVLKTMHVVTLTMLLNCIQEYAYVGAKKLATLEKCGVLPSDRIYKNAEHAHEEVVDSFKKRSITSLIALHPQVFRPILQFEDWDSAMEYLEKNKKIVKLFLA